ncbi:MAG: hypothetical protein ACYS91_20580 [Planctomycetota bacterium]
MTAEIAVMNKSAVALAADSAATLELEKVHKIYMTNKLFALSESHPVGIMIYQKPELLGVPWETVIEMYRKKLKGKKFGTLTEYSDDLISFIKSANDLFPKGVQKKFFQDSLVLYYTKINDDIEKKVESYTKKKKITKVKTRQIADSVISKHCRALEKRAKIPNVSNAWVRNLLTKYASTIMKVKNEVFVKLPISATSMKNLKKITGYLFSKDAFFRSDFSGLVMAGFGNDDIYPRVKSFEIEGMIDGKLKYMDRQEGETGQDNDACIIPFAQRDMVDSFMQGVHPDYHKHLFRGLKSLLMEKYPNNILAEVKDLSEKKRKSIVSKLEEINEGILDEYREELKSHSYKKHIRPVIGAVSLLPKGELAEMAETLVSLISFKKRMSVDVAETVGGPIDVAVISKADGFVWIKHKRYFKSELNL